MYIIVLGSYDMLQPYHMCHVPRFVTCGVLCMQLTITQNPKAQASNEILPVSYPKFTTMIQKGDTIFIGRYLVTGSEDSSLYVKVRMQMQDH